MDPLLSLFRRTPRRVDPLLESLTGGRGRLQAALCMGVLGLNLWLLSFPSLDPLERLDRITLDQFFKYRPPLRTDPSIVCIEIAEDSLLQIGRWPWPRQYHAALTHALQGWGAKAVVFDILFSDPSSPSDDKAFAEALAESGRVYLPLVLENHRGRPVWIHSLASFERHAKGVGHINATPDRDGILRRVQPVLREGSEQHPYLSLKVAYDLLGRPVPPPERLPFPRDRDGSLLINWAGRWTETFRHYSYLDLLRSFEAVNHGRKPIVPPELLRGKICLIGLTAVGHTDLKAIPLEPVYPAMGFHANVINSLLTKQFVTPAPLFTNALCLIGIGLIATVLFMLFRPVIASAASLLLGGGWLGLAYFLFCCDSLWISVAHPLFCIGSIFLASVVYLQVAEEKTEERLSDLATRDGLTGLHVIRHFRGLLNEATAEARRRQAPLSVLMIDIDHFKQVNDTYGHPAGDRVLKQAAAIVQSSLRESDDAGRYGGEEMIVMLPRTSLEAALPIAERIRAAVAQATSDFREGTISVTVSIGAATLDPDETSPDPMVQRADEAMYQAKQGGRNRVCRKPTT
ncbi:MAG: CHASE2 domain-containing protein [Candidatus Omnitrophica bacterium]|nr:CHASE2 domain-containing protein [Candidatus Omnitrophota bacterium]